MSFKTSTTGLIVPINAVAFCVGEADEQLRTGGLAGATTVYASQVRKDYNAYLGCNVHRGLEETEGGPYNRLQQGVHIHWTLPDALTKSESDPNSKKLIFPAVPNRWLLTRIVIENGTIKEEKVKSWIIESDALSSVDDPENKRVTLPVKDSHNDFNYVGQWQDLKDWKPDVDSGFFEKTGCELSTVSSGVVSFASYYPDCNTIFGFWDQLNDVKSKSDIDLMYVVTGWYNNPENDPLTPLILARQGNDPENEQKLLENVQKRLKWTFDDSKGLTPSCTVYSGLVEGIKWNPFKPYLDSQPSELPGNVAIGNNPAEAISAYFKNQKNLGELTEPILNAFQMGLLNDFQSSQPNRIEQLYESLHNTKFNVLDSGNIYTIVRKDDADCNGDQEGMIDLPPKLAEDLNLLNLLQQKFDQLQLYLKEYRLQLFFGWYRIFMASDENRDDAYSTVYHKYYNYIDQVNSESFREIDKQLQDQKDLVGKQLGETLKLKQAPAPRFYQPSEPVVLIDSPYLIYPSRYGGDGRFDQDGYLKCRLPEQVLTEVTVNNISVPNIRFDNLILPERNGLPYLDLCSNLLKEACLMNPSLIAPITGSKEEELIIDLKEFLAGKGTRLLQGTGEMISPVGVTWWGDKNPWLPLFVCWKTEYLPINPIGKDFSDYSENFFTNNFDICKTDSIVYLGAYPISSNDPQKYKGEALLQPSSAKNFADQLTEYVHNHEDQETKYLNDILQDLKTSNILIQPLSGFSGSLLMRQNSLQLNIEVPKGSDYEPLTEDLKKVINKKIGTQNSIGPDFRGSFNPLRAGYLTKLELQVIDAFGQRKNVNFPQLICAESMIAYNSQKKPVIYLEPRISQPSRLLFRWISADSTGYDEMNSHPATSPICGWLLPDHLNEGFFIYNQQGKPLGFLYLNGNKTKVEWQSAPGDDSTINKNIEEVLKNENPQLKNLAVTLKKNTADFFMAFWNAVDRAHESINPQNLISSSGLAVLIGRPVALVQAMLRLEVDGSPVLNQGWDFFKDDTDNGFSSIQFPVILGDQSQLDDGLIGYFKTDHMKNDYDYNTFYVEDPHSVGKGVVKPDNTNLLVTVAQKIDTEIPPKLEAFNQKVLMLVDPRASVKATTGILPTKRLDLPSDLCDSALSILEMSFPVSPILEGASGLSLPIPQENGYQFSWIEEDKANAKNSLNGGTGLDLETETGGSNVEWVVKPDILGPTDKAIWAYTPQRITEGWLRMNPLLLEFIIMDDKKDPVVTGGQYNSLKLIVVNKKHSSIKFKKGTLVPEEDEKSGSIFYIHLGNLVNKDNVGQIKFSADGWMFKEFENDKYGQYWAVMPTDDFNLKPFTPEKNIPETEYSFTISMTNLLVSARGSQSQVYFDYYNIEGLNDGVYVELLTVQSQ